MCAWRVTNCEGESSHFPARQHPVCHQMNVKSPSKLKFLGLGGISFEEGSAASNSRVFLTALTNTFILAHDFFLFSSPSLPNSLSEQTGRASSEEEERPTGGGSGGLWCRLRLQRGEPGCLPVCLRQAASSAQHQGSVSEDKVRSGSVWMTRLEMGSAVIAFTQVLTVALKIFDPHDPSVLVDRKDAW